MALTVPTAEAHSRQLASVAASTSAGLALVLVLVGSGAASTHAGAGAGAGGSLGALGTADSCLLGALEHLRSKPGREWDEQGMRRKWATKAAGSSFQCSSI